MDNAQLKLILAAYRPDGEDTSDPLFAEALEQVHQDSELADWFKEECRFDRSVRKALADELPPPTLRDSLLLNRKLIRPSILSGANSSTWTPPVRWLAVAAILTVFLGIGFLLRPLSSEPLTGAQFVQEVFELKTSGGISLGKMGGGPEELRAWLAAQGSPADYVLPDKLKTLGELGCQTFTMGGHRVSLLCFMIDNNRVVHFFITESIDLTNPPTEKPTFIENGDLVAVTWSKGGHTYVLTGKGIDEETLRELI